MMPVVRPLPAVIVCIRCSDFCAVCRYFLCELVLEDPRRRQNLSQGTVLYNVKEAVARLHGDFGAAAASIALTGEHTFVNGINMGTRLLLCTGSLYNRRWLYRLSPVNHCQHILLTILVLLNKELRLTTCPLEDLPYRGTALLQQTLTLTDTLWRPVSLIQC